MPMERLVATVEMAPIKPTRIYGELRKLPPPEAGGNGEAEPAGTESSGGAGSAGPAA